MSKSGSRPPIPVPRVKPGVAAPNLPAVGVSLGVTGHRAAHPVYAANAGRIRSVIGSIFDTVQRATAHRPDQAGGFVRATTRLTTLMVDGVDQAAAELALERGWKLFSPLPFGRQLNIAINALPVNAADAEALRCGMPASDHATQERADRIADLSAKAQIFDLADQDERLARLYLAKLDDPHDAAKAQAFTNESSARAMLAGQIVIAQSDILIGVWDGVSTTNQGGAGQTIAAALEHGAPVVWIDPAVPEQWRFLHAPESLADLARDPSPEDREAVLEALIGTVLSPGAPMHDTGIAKRGLAALYDAQWEDRSSTLTHTYRKIEAMFGGEARRLRSVTQIYERPDEIASGSGAAIITAAREFPGGDAPYVDKVEQQAMRNFAWADGLSARLSDRYRGGMVVNFLLSSIAIVGGVAYLPLVDAEHKWAFALFEFLLLLAIVSITWRGVNCRWHGRWFETRRVAEYLRHSPFLLLLGWARPPGRWPKGTGTSWPEWIARHILRDIGLPHVTITAGYLRPYLALLLDCHVRPQRDYHAAKARRLKAVHHNLDRLSELMFLLAILSVASFLLLEGGAVLGIVDRAVLVGLSKTFTVLGVMFPTFGGAIAGIRFFGDFERFAAISEMTSQRLDGIAERIALLQTAPDSELGYERVVRLAQATDDAVISEIENWQAVFRGKRITVPV